MLNSGVLEELNGVISTGKESHVYHAITGENKYGKDIPLLFDNIQKGCGGIGARTGGCGEDLLYGHDNRVQG